MISIVTIFYTVVGGLKAVVLVDTIQTLIMFIGIIICLIMVGAKQYFVILPKNCDNFYSLYQKKQGFVLVGDPAMVWEAAAETGRLEIFKE